MSDVDPKSNILRKLAEDVALRVSVHPFSNSHTAIRRSSISPGICNSPSSLNRSVRLGNKCTWSIWRWSRTQHRVVGSRHTALARFRVKNTQVATAWFWRTSLRIRSARLRIWSNTSSGVPDRSNATTSSVLPARGTVCVRGSVSPAA